MMNPLELDENKIDPIFAMSEKTKNNVLRTLAKHFEIKGDEVNVIAKKNITYGVGIATGTAIKKLIQKHGK